MNANEGGSVMSTWSCALLAFTVLAAVVIIGGQAIAYHQVWRGLFAIFLILSFASFAFEYLKQDAC